MQQTIIRASQLDSWKDCQRRSVTQRYPELFAEQGYHLRELPPGIGASIGTAVHAGVAAMLTASLNAIPIAQRHVLGTAAALQSFVKIANECDSNFGWDKSTDSTTRASGIIESLIEIYFDKVLPAVQPRFIEKTFTMDLGDGFTLQGTIDCYDDFDILRDFKTGNSMNQEGYRAQAGAYLKLLLAAGHSPKGAQLDWIKRDGSQDPKHLKFLPSQAIRVAERAIQEVKGAMFDFLSGGLEFRSLDEIFPANPNSYLCSAKWCPAHSTDACSHGK